ncbi:hypothetical protein FPV67DRAFT_253420 [Lyophyllum atratum]|nr:hypothetical protein FPV67DRAFT_253420 [Lyophyllum atratum]
MGPSNKPAVPLPATPALAKESAQHNDADAAVQVSLPTMPVTPSNIMCDSGTQTSGDSRTSGRLLSYRQARRTRGSLLYGFPLDEKGSMQCGEKLLPIDPELTGDARETAEVRRFPVIFRYLRTVCDPVWPTDRTEVEVGWTGHEQHTLLALVACTRRNDELIPQGEVLQKLKDIMANEGYEEEPGWFVVLT